MRMMPFVEAFLIDKIVNSNVIVSNKSKAGIILLGLSLISLIGALILGIIASYHWLLTRYEPDVAALFAATFVLILSALFGLIGYALINRRRSRMKSMQKEITDHVVHLFEAVSEELELPERIRDNPKTAVAIATLAGFFLADRIL